jgi:DUF971 family protein
MEAPKTPTRIEPQGPSDMLVAWNTGESYAVPYVELRFVCPCASCVDEHTGKRILQRDQVKPDVRPLGVQLVGRYAINVAWSDGHSTGMYHFDLLFKVCEKQGRRISH